MTEVANRVAVVSGAVIVARACVLLLLIRIVIDVLSHIVGDLSLGQIGN